MDPRLLRSLLHGAAAGALAAIPQAMVGKTEELALLPPWEDTNIAPRLMDRLGTMVFGEHPTEVQKWALGTAFHFGYGAWWGVAYAAATHRRPVPPLLGGALLAGVIYGITFPRWGGAVRTGVERSPRRRTPQMTFVAASVTLTFGLATAGIHRWLDLRGARADGERAAPGERRGAYA